MKRMVYLGTSSWRGSSHRCWFCVESISLHRAICTTAATRVTLRVTLRALRHRLAHQLEGALLGLVAQRKEVLNGLLASRMLLA